MKKPTRELVDAFLDWFRDDAHAARENYYAETVTETNLSKMERKQFIEFFYQFAHDGGHVQSGGHRTASRFRETIDTKYDDFRSFVLDPFSSSFNEIQWLQRIREYAHFGVGLATIYLNRVDKKRFAIINNKAAEAVEILNITVPSALAPRYQAVRDAWQQMIEWYPEFENYYRTDALSQFLIGEDQGKSWASQLRASEGQSTKRYWIYAPGERARHWEDFRREGLMGLGWDTIKEDLSVYSTEEELREKYNELYGDKATVKDFRQLCDFVQKVREGDGVFVKRGTKELVGYGEVTSGYFYATERPEYRHLRRAKWLATGEWPLPKEGKNFPVKTLTELRNEERVRQYRAMMGLDGKMHLTAEAFSLLEQLHNTPTVEYYNKHRTEFKKYLEQPFQHLLRAVAQRLRPEITELMETERHVFSRIPKNDYGRGGAWDFYWGAFYPKGGKRTENAQLFASINDKQMGFGFYIGEYGSEQRSRFTNGCSEYLDILKKILKESLSQTHLAFGDRSTADNDVVNVAVPGIKWDEWLQNVDQHGIRVAVDISRDEILAMSGEELVTKMVEVFDNLFPLVYLATKDDALTYIRRYVGDDIPDPEDNVAPEYSLEQCAADTYFDLDMLRRWVQSIERKKQAIFYGPPGTGKTYMAQQLARHLIGGGAGFAEVLQFHPSYAYEDFMQGLRPKALKAGGLEYAMVPGRFKDFCMRAGQCKGKCVLVIDEINRANLARVFGELMYLLEYRKEFIPLAGGERFKIPENVFIIGTMNTADRSIALVDHALRRRFAFLALYPNYEMLRKYHASGVFNPDGLITVLERVNTAINDRHYSIGVSFFLDTDIRSKLQDVWQREIEPYLEEFFFDQPDKSASFGWEKVESEIIGK